jgi:hypothetical protein
LYRKAAICDRICRLRMYDAKMQNRFLPGVPIELVEAALLKAGGNELDGKFDNPRSSAALAVNGFGWFIERPHLLPALPGLEDVPLTGAQVTVERQMRFPWRGGRHPWLDAAIETPTHLIGIESKRYEPFRSAKPAKLSKKYSEHVWGEGMDAWNVVRDQLLAEPRFYRHLDGAQLVKHAYGLATVSDRRDKAAVLYYIYAEPNDAADEQAFALHREEICDLARRVQGARVRFAACSWSQWLAKFSGEAAGHARAIIQRYKP